MQTQAKVNGSSQRTLLLAPPSVATKEDKLRDVFQTFDRSTTDLQMLDRLSAGVVALPSDTYDLILVLADGEAPAASAAPLRLLNRNVYTALVPSMKAGAKLQVESGSFDATETREAILAGLVEKDGVFEKQGADEVVAIPLRRPAKKAAARATAPAIAPVTAQVGTTVTLSNLDSALDGDDDDELIDEDTLLNAEDLKRIQPRKSRLWTNNSLSVPIANGVKPRSAYQRSERDDAPARTALVV